MTVTNKQSGTNVHEVAEGIYRINTPVTIEGAGGFSFNQYLIADDQPLLFHTGPRKMFPLVCEAVAEPVAGRQASLHCVFPRGGRRVRLAKRLAARGSGFCCPVCGTVAAMVSISDLADREPRALADGDTAPPRQAIPCGGSIRHTCRTPGNAASCAGSAPVHPAVWRPVHPGRRRQPP